MGYWLEQIRSAQAFMRGYGAGNVGGQFSHVQLINPSGSGVMVIVKRVIVMPDGNALVELRRHDTALSNDAGAGVNLDAGGTAGSGHVRFENNAAAQGTVVSQIRLQGSAPYAWIEDWFYKLDPGEGFLFVPAGVNNGIQAHFEWIEY